MKIKLKCLNLFLLKDQLVSLVNMLMVKVPPLDHFDFKTEQVNNLEAMALSYIFVVMLVIFIYQCPQEQDDTLNDDPDTFQLKDWLSNILNCMIGLKRITNGIILFS